MSTLTEKEIAMYIGCLAKLDHVESPVIIRGVRNSQVLCQYTDKDNENKQHWRHIEGDGVKLMLRPLSDITDQEKQQYQDLQFLQQATAVHSIYVRVDTAKSIMYLVNQGFDMFEHIKNNKAIETTIKR